MLSATPPLFKGTDEKVVSQCKPGSIGDRWAQYVNQNENNYKPSVFANQDEMVDDILKMDKDNAYKTRGGMKKLKECDCGSCLGTGSSLSDGTPGENPNAGRYDTKLGTVRRRIHITEEQLKYIQEATAGDIGTGGQTGIAYPFSGVKPNEPTMNHKNIMKDAMPK